MLGPEKACKRGKPKVVLAAFGKHPGWDDHIEDIGLASERLVHVRRRLYVEGIARNVELGAWDKLEPVQTLPEFHHLLVWRTARDVVVARMWPSRDGKGRARYPMVVCAQCCGLSLAWALGHLPAALEDIERRSVAAATAAWHDGIPVRRPSNNV